MKSNNDYKDENLWLMYGDCLERMNEIPDGSIDLAVIDPPYKMTNNGKSCRPNFAKVVKNNNLFGTKHNDSWIDVLYRLMATDSHCYIFTNVQSIEIYLSKMKEAGFKLHNIISMIKDTKMPNRWYLKYTEFILFFRKGKAFPINDMTSRDYIYAKMPTKRNGRVHETQKPLDVVAKLIENSSIENATVLDIFMGSGTTGVACKNLNRKFIGIEMDDHYFEVGKNRILNHGVDNEGK